METKQYLSANGDLMRVSIVDKENKQVFATTNGVDAKWFLEREYSTWQGVMNVYVPDIPAQVFDAEAKEAFDDSVAEIEEPTITEEEPKVKKTRKKKNDDSTTKE